MKYELRTESGRLLGTMTGYPEAVLAARALAHAEPVGIDHEAPKTWSEWDAHVENLRRFVGA